MALAAVQVIRCINDEGDALDQGSPLGSMIEVTHDSGNRQPG